MDNREVNPDNLHHHADNPGARAARAARVNRASKEDQDPDKEVRVDRVVRVDKVVRANLANKEVPGPGRAVRVATNLRINRNEGGTDGVRGAYCTIFITCPGAHTWQNSPLYFHSQRFINRILDLSPYPQ